MDLFRASTRPLAGAKQALRAVRAQRRGVKTARVNSALKYTYPTTLKNVPPQKGFMKELEPPTPTKIHPPIPIFPSPPPIHTLCPTPLIHLNTTFLSTLDPSGTRQRLFAARNPEGIKPGDIILVRRRNGDPFSGVVMNIRRGHDAAEGGLGVDTAVLLRNTLTRVGVEVWFKVFAKEVTGVEVVKRAERRARRKRLTYLRLPKHDLGSLEGIVNAYLRQKAGLISSSGKQTKGKGKKGKR